MPERMITYAQALREALDHELAAEPNMILLGEDIGRGGGMYTVTKGLYETYGPRRVIDTPISEAGFVGLGVGSALAGLRPVVELMFIDFALVAMDQLLNQAAKIPFLTSADQPTSLPLTIRTQQGIAGGGGPQHSQSLEGIFAHVPGLDVALPATPADAKGLLTTALRSSRPTIVIEHKALYFTKGDVPESSDPIPFGEARMVKEGDDLTIITYSAEVRTATEAAARLAADGISAEILDLRTLRPFDTRSVVESVAKTGRGIVLHESSLGFGPGAEIAATATEGAWRALKAPVIRIGGKNTPVPFGQELESAWRPSAEEVVQAATRLVKT